MADIDIAGIVDAVAVAENVDVWVDTLYASVYDTLSITEDVDVWADTLYISIFETSSIAESISRQLDLNPNIFDSITVAENVSAGLFYKISVYDGVTATDVPAIMRFVYWWTDPRPTHMPHWPVWSLEATTGTRIDCNPARMKMFWEMVEGSFGAQLDELAPDYALSASCSVLTRMSVVGLSPTWVVSSFSGSRLSKKVPTASLEIELSGINLLRLNKIVPGWSLEGAMSGPIYLTLTKRAPFWIVEGEGSVVYINILELKTPFWIPSAENSILVGQLLELEETAPVWELEGNMACFYFTLDVNIPAWITEYGVGILLVDSSRFDGYELQYVRP